MLILSTKIPANHNFNIPPRWWRELNALRATALDAARFPVLARGWRGPLIIGDRLCCHNNSPLARRFKTAPVVEIKGPEGTGDWRGEGGAA